MKFNIALLLGVLTLANAKVLQFDTSKYNDVMYGAPIPMPAYIKIENKAFALADDFKFNLSQKSCELLNFAVQRAYKNILKTITAIGVNINFNDAIPFHSLNITVSQKCDSNSQLMPSSTMDESYSLVIDDPIQSTLTAPEVWGALRGLETFLQLLYRVPSGLLILNQTTIVDKPRFLHRGLLLDTSRHFQTMSTIYQNLDAMAINKLNVFHWHIVDDQSFPYQSTSFPDMSDKGAYNRYTHVYTQNDIADVIEYARRLGIRVIPEFDTPGHTLSWGKAYPSLLTACYSGSQPDGSYGPIDPTQESTFDYLTTFFQEIKNVFPDTYLHLGGDEVSFDCWKSNPTVQAFMVKNNWTDYSSLESYYMAKLISLIQSDKNKKLFGKYMDADKKLLVWQEVFDNKVALDKDVLVHVWKGSWEDEMAAVTKAGYTALLSSCWYLDGQLGQWTNFYSCEPLNFSGSDTQKALVFGGETCMWGENVDATNSISRIWPRASAVAERLWSPKEVTDQSVFAARAKILTCRMMRRGLRASPIFGPSFCEEEFVDSDT